MNQNKPLNMKIKIKKSSDNNMKKSFKENSENLIDDLIASHRTKHSDNYTHRNNNEHPKKYATQTNFNATFLTRSLNNPRLLGMSEYNSSTSLRNSSYIWSIPKTMRFNNLYKKSLTDSIYNIPVNKSERGTTQGYGQKYDLIPLQGRSSPPPNTYKVKSFVDENFEKKKGILVGERISELPHPTLNFPGPGSYNLKQSQKNKNLISIKSRTMMFYDDDLQKQKHCVSPQKYLPSTKVQQNLRYTHIGFGFGDKSSVALINNLNVPGPGTYNLPSVFDLKRKTKLPLN